MRRRSTAAAAAALVLLALAQACLAAASNPSDSSEAISCRVHVVNHTDSAAQSGVLRSSLRVYAASDVQDVSVVLQIQAEDVAVLEVALEAVSSAAAVSRAVLKAAAPAGSRGTGPNMIQTIFSDYASVALADVRGAGVGGVGWPSAIAHAAALCVRGCTHTHAHAFHTQTHTPCRHCVTRTQGEAPYSGVYRPAQTLRSLVAGDSTLAGAGGSKGVWTLVVQDKAPNGRCACGRGVRVWCECQGEMGACCRLCTCAHALCCRRAPTPACTQPAAQARGLGALAVWRRQRAAV
jgi:hypothetical protein